jgi:hypothetical protein
LVFWGFFVFGSFGSPVLQGFRREIAWLINALLPPPSTTNFDFFTFVRLSFFFVSFGHDYRQYRLFPLSLLTIIPM